MTKFKDIQKECQCKIASKRWFGSQKAFMTHKRGPAWSCNVNDRIRKYKLGYFPILILIIS